MKSSLRFLLLVVLLVATFCSGWVAKSNYDNWANVDPLAHQAVAIDGIVLRTRENLAAISVGSNDGLRNGTLIHFYRNNQILGTGKTVWLRNNMSAVQMIEATRQGLLKEGDVVIAGN